MLRRSGTLLLFGFTLALATTGAVGCGDGGDDDATMSLTWDVAYLGGGLVSCANAGTPAVHMDARHVSSGESFAFDFPCDRKVGVTRAIPRGTYDITLSLLDAKNRPVAATAGFFEVRRHGTTRLDPVEFQVLSWQVSWAFSLESAGTTRPANCTDVGVAKVEFITQQASETADSYMFDCGFGAGVTAAIRAGSYSYQLRIFDAAGQMLSQTEPQPLLVTADKQPAVSEIFRFKR